MSWNERQDDYSSVAFWYQQGPSTFTVRAPENRTLPSLDRVTAFARDSESHGAGETQKQALDLYPDGPQLLYMPKTQEGAWIEIPFEVKEKEPLRLVLNMTTSYDFGKYQAYVVSEGLSPVPGWKVGGPMDFYSEKILNREFHLLDFWPDPGRYSLRLQCVGKNAKSDGFLLGIESVRLRERRPRVKEMGWDKDKDWRKNPVLYG